MWPVKWKSLLNYLIMLIAFIVVEVCSADPPPIYSLKSYGADIVSHVGDSRGKKKYKKYYKKGHGHGHAPHHVHHQGGHEGLEMALSIDLNMLAAAVGAIALLLMFASLCYTFTHKKRRSFYGRAESEEYDDSSYYTDYPATSHRVGLTDKILTAIEKLKSYYKTHTKKKV